MNLSRLQCDTTFRNEAAHYPQIERISDCNGHKDKNPMPRLKARLIEAYREVSGLNAHDDLHIGRNFLFAGRGSGRRGRPIACVDGSVKLLLNMQLILYIIRGLEANITIIYRF